MPASELASTEPRIQSLSIHKISPYRQAATLTPLAPLPANTTVTVKVVGVTDLAGNVAGTTTSQFVTGASPAFNPPQVVTIEPAQFSNLPTNTKVFSLTFNEPIDPASVTSTALTLQENNSNLPGTVSQSPDGKTVFFTTSQALTPGDSVVLAFFSYLTDLAGNVVTCCGGYTNYTVGTSAASTPLSIIDFSPKANWKNVPVNVNLQLLLSAVPDMTSLSGIQLLEGSTVIPLTPVPGNGAAPILTLQTASLLDPNQNYTLNIAGIRDVVGNSLTHSMSIPFTTGPGANLGLLSATLITPANPSSASPKTSIQVKFSAPVNSVTLGMSLENSNYRQIPVTLSLSSDGTTATWTPVSPLSPGNYTLNVGASDDAGNYLFESLYTAITVL
jgi:large repetitive protein